MKLRMYAKRCYVALTMALLLFATDVFAGCPITALPNNGGNSGFARCPSTRYRKAQSVYIITAAELAANGMISGQNITSIGWNYLTAPVTAGTGTLVVYLQNTTDVTNLKSTAWATAITGMTTVHNAATLLPGTAGAFDFTLSGGSPFTYTGGGLYVAFDWCYLSPNPLSTTAAVSCNNTLANGLLGLQNTTATVCTPLTPTAGSAFRPETRFTQTGLNIDAKVDLIYTYGSLPNVFTAGHQMQARITNNGNTSLTSYPVTLSITGANSFSDVQNITLAPCSSTTVTFNGFTPSATGTNTVVVSVPSDDNNANNSQTLSQPVTSNLYSYKYSAPITGGVGFGAGVFGAFVSRFNSASAAQINEVKVDFQAVTAGTVRDIRIGVWGDNVGVPGTLLYSSPSVISISTAAQTAFIPISPTVSVTGTFYVGIIQETSSTGNIAFSYQTENPSRFGTFFFANSLTGPWTDFGSGFPFRSAIEVQLYIPQPPNCPILNSPADASEACSVNGTTLNWASGGGGPTGYRLTFGTNAPNYDNILNDVDQLAATSYNTGVLVSGQTYGWKVTAYNVDGTSAGCLTRTFTATLSACYCTPTYATGTGFGDYISVVEIPTTTLSNPSGASVTPFYTKYPQSGSTTGTLAAGNTYSMNVAGGTFDDCFIRGWIDYNQNGIFEASETIGVSPNAGLLTTVSFNFTVPNGATAGTTRMRMRSSDTSPGPSDAQSCGATNSAFGETEDYDITIVLPTPCSGTPVPGNTTASATTVCDGDPFDLGITANFSLSSGISYQWESSADDITFSPISGATNSTLTTSASTSTYYHCVVTCSNTGFSGTSISILIAVNPLPNVDVTANPGSAQICGTGSVILSATGAVNYFWGPAAGLSGTTGTPVTATPSATTEYFVLGVDANGCGNLDSIVVTVSPAVTVAPTADTLQGCTPLTTVLHANASETVSNYNVSSIAYNPIAGSGAQAVTGDDAVSGAITLPFTFSYYGVNYTQLFVYTNGFVQLGTSSGNTATYNDVIPSAATPNNIIAGVWNDFVATAGQITTYTSGVSPNQVFVIDYNNLGFYNNGNPLVGNGKFQIHLKENGIVEVHLTDVTGTSATTGSKTLGVENASGTAGTSPVGRNAATWSTITNEAWRFSPVQPVFTYLWTPNTSLDFDNVANPNVVNLTGTTNYNVLVTAPSGCTATANINLTVLPIPATPSITPSGATSFCPGNSVTLSSSSDPGYVSYEWISSGELTSSILLTPPTNSTTVRAVKVYGANGCSSTSSNVTVVVYDTIQPTITVIGSSNLCTGQTTADLQSSAAASYLWSTSETSDLITVSTSGTYSVQATDANGCVTSNHQVITETSPPAAPIVTPAGPVTLCTDGMNTSSQILTVTNYPGPGLSWSEGSSDVNMININYADNFFALYTDGNGCTSQSNIVVANVRPYSLPASSIGGDSTGCFGSSITMNVVGGTLESGDSWVWYEGTCGGTFVGTGASITISPSAGPHTYFVRAEGACGNTTCISRSVLIYSSGQLGTAQNVIVPASGCQGQTIAVTTAAIAGASYYQWSAPAGSLINGLPSPQITSGPSMTLTLGAPVSSGWYICVQGGNPCGTTVNTKCNWIRGTVTSPLSISGNIVACPNTGDSYSCPAVTGADGYVWTITGDATVIGTGTSATVSFGPSFTSGQLCVKASLSCGYQSAPRCITISSATPAPGAMTGPSTICPGGSASFSIPAIAVASGYNWTIPAGAMITSGIGTNSVTIQFPVNYTTGTVCVTANSSCGVPSVQRCKTVVSGLPGIVATISGPLSGVCNSGQNYNASSVANATAYNWSVTGGSIQGANGNSTVTIQWNSNVTTGSLSVTASNACGNGGTRTVSVRLIPGVPGAISGSSSVCLDGVGNYSIPLLNGTTFYNWSAPAPASIIGNGSDMVTVDFNGVPNGNYSVTCTPSNICGNSNTVSFAVSVINCARMISNSTSVEMNVSAYPNPAHDKVNVEFNSTSANQFEISITDLSGRSIQTIQGSAVKGLNKVEINVNDLAKGLYILKLDNNQSQSVMNIVVE